MALLNGKIVDAKDIDPKIHMYLGTFRPAEPPPFDICGAAISGERERATVTIRELWKQGEYDQPQYVTVDKVRPNIVQEAVSTAHLSCIIGSRKDIVRFSELFNEFCNKVESELSEIEFGEKFINLKRSIDE